MKTTKPTIADYLSYSNQKFSITDPIVETVLDHPYTRRRSRLVDRRVEWLDSEGYTSCKCKGVGQ